MGLHKIFKIIAALLGVVGIICLIRIISEGDDAIKDAAAAGDTALVEPFAIIAYIILGLVLLLVLGFVLKNLFANPKSLKSTLIGVGLFAAVLLISYMVSGGDTRQYALGEEGMFASEGQSQMVGAGLVAFYVLIFGAVGAMIFSGVKKMISK
ncbi:hypothetical protein RM697_03940 [Ichthyenterobacterium sp. W332]|uniref:Uncharacterized protein n=1 Tax=Microcosmobacter mediterraneus TaxID=3075607 RepID=A0ABU2YHY7_9FLAO|nr:hypothetical protein [Ichthyenterobacterium sp. W332]MDT0557782.1 hypothetical protein [Ichthyenterobacterium sp. W332]